MSDRKTNNPISPSEAEALLRAHDGDCALLHLWMAVSGSRDYERAARDLCMTRAQVDSAAEKLSRMFSSCRTNADHRSRSTQGDYFSPEENSVPRPPVIQPPEELPEYPSADIDSCFNSDSGFRALLAECEQIFGKQLSRHDMSRLLGIYNHLGLPAEVVFILLHYCADTSRGPAGAERKPTMRYIEQQAYIWVNRQINTMEAAEEYVEQQKALRENENRIRHILEIYDRSLTSAEKAAISSWIKMGFADDAIRLAYERCIDSIDKRSVSYINGILQRWHEAGIHTASEAEAIDPGKNQKTGVKNTGRTGRTDRRPFTPTEF